jgi:hypothetical protein
MNTARIALTLLLLPIPAAAQGVGSLTFLEGTARVLRGTSVLRGAEGVGLKQGDIIESSDKGFVQLEFAGGVVVALGPSSRVYIFRAGGKGGAELVLLGGWLKGESGATAGNYRYATPQLSAATGNGTILLHDYGDACDAFVESGSANIGEEAGARKGVPGKAGTFFSRRAGREISSAPRPTQAFIDAMPKAFKDTLPPRASRFAGKSIEAKEDHAVTYAEVRPYLTMPAGWRHGLVERFQPRLSDPEFRKQLEAHVNEYPEWDLILHPEKHRPENSPAPTPNAETSHPRASL